MVQNYRILFRVTVLWTHLYQVLVCVALLFVVVYSSARAAGPLTATSIMRAPKCRSTTLRAQPRVSHLTKHGELGGPPWAQLFSILGRFSKSGESNFAQPTFLPSPTNKPHVRQKAQEITQTFTKTHSSGDSHQYRYCSARFPSRAGH